MALQACVARPCDKSGGHNIVTGALPALPLPAISQTWSVNAVQKVWYSRNDGVWEWFEGAAVVALRCLALCICVPEDPFFSPVEHHVHKPATWHWTQLLILMNASD